MFVISQSSSYKWPVSVEFPVDGGKTEKQTFDGEFKRLSQSRIDEVRKAVTDDLITEREFAKEVLVGWSGIVDSESGEVPFSERARDDLLNVPMVSNAIVMAFMNSLSGVKRKN